MMAKNEIDADASKERYQIEDQRMQKRTSAFSEADDLADRRQDIGLLRASIERAAAENNFSVLNSLTATLDKYLKNSFRESVVRHRLCGRESLFRFMARICELLESEAKAHFPDGQWEDFLYSISEKLNSEEPGSPFSELYNTEREISLLQIPR